MAALLLDPDNEECLPLIARVFPGKSRTNLLESRDAETISNRLASLARSKPPEAEREAVSVLGSKGLLSYDIQLRMSAEDKPFTPPAPPTSATEGEGQGEGGTGGVDRAGGEGREETGAGESALSPRLWHVLDGPVPTLDEGGAATSVMPALRVCMHEKEFHAMIYYSKKKVRYCSRLVWLTSRPVPLQCTAEVQSVLNCPTEIGPAPPKLQAHTGAQFGERTVAQR